MGNRGALVGPQGSGKTTLLENLQPLLHKQGCLPMLLRLNQHSTRPEKAKCLDVVVAISARHFILLDGAEQLSWWEWQKFKWQIKAAAGLVITTHRPGRLPTLHQCQTSFELFQTLVKGLLPDSGLTERLSLADIYYKRQGNLRLAFLDLYDLFTRSGAQ